MKRLVFDALLVMLAALLIGFCVLTFFPLALGQSSGNVTFQPSAIPDLTVSARVGRNNESFRFEWLGNRFDIELFFNATIEKKGVNVTRLWSLQDFEDDFGVSVQYVVEREATQVRFGWQINNTASVSDHVHNALFKIEDTQPFDYDEIVLEQREIDVDQNATFFVLPDNLELSFHDLEFKGFVIGWQNKTSTSIKGFSGKRSWNLDPVTFSSSIMTFTGTTTNLFWQFWNASNVNGWGVAWNNDEQDVQFTFGCKLQVGDGSTATTASDKNVQVTFNSTASPSYQFLLTIKNNAQLTLGTLISAADRSTKDGISLIYAKTIYSAYLVSGEAGSTVYVYGCRLDGAHAYSTSRVYGNSRIYNTIFDQTYLWIGGAGGTHDIYKLVTAQARFGVRFETTGVSMAFQDVTSYNPTEQGFFTAYGQNPTAKNLIFRGVPTNKLGRLDYYTGATYAVNWDSNTWGFTWVGTCTGEVYRQYEFDLTVVYQNATVIQNANVTITYFGQGGGAIGSWMTNSTGQIPTQTLTKGFYNVTGGNTIYSLEPYNLQITYEGMQTFSKNFTLTEKTVREKALVPQITGEDGEPTPTFNSVYYLLGGVSLLPFALLFGYLISRRHENE